jgi:hypothetical protein
MKRTLILWSVFIGMVLLTFAEGISLLSRCFVSCEVPFPERLLFMPSDVLWNTFGIYKSNSDYIFVAILGFLWPASLLTLIVAIGLKKMRHPLTIACIIIPVAFVVSQLALNTYRESDIGREAAIRAEYGQNVNESALKCALQKDLRYESCFGEEAAKQPDEGAALSFCWMMKDGFRQYDCIYTVAVLKNWPSLCAHLPDNVLESAVNPAECTEVSKGFPGMPSAMAGVPAYCDQLNLLKHRIQCIALAAGIFSDSALCERQFENDAESIVRCKELIGIDWRAALGESL